MKRFTLLALTLGTACTYSTGTKYHECPGQDTIVVTVSKDSVVFSNRCQERT